MPRLTAVELQKIANARRTDVVKMIYRAGGGHMGGDLSETDILTCLYYRVMNVRPEQPDWAERDRFLLSKGHSVESYYAILADRGFFPREWLEGFSTAGSPLIGHPNNKVPGVELCTGALGHGLPVGVGIALGAKRLGRAFRTFVVMGDGEQAEGSVWEAAMAGANYKLGNLCAIVDRNGLQISGPTENVMALDDLADKWRAFGWDVHVVDGNDMQQLLDVLEYDVQAQEKPRCVIARTTKGRGVSFMENRPEWHHKVPTQEQYEQALKELTGEVQAQ